MCSNFATTVRATPGEGTLKQLRYATARFAVLFWLILLFVACGGRSAGDRDTYFPDLNNPQDSQSDQNSVGDSQETPDSSLYPPPNTNLVSKVGDEKHLDIATWNLREFPLGGSTPKFVADLIASMDLDLIAVQEVTSEVAFKQLVDRLPGYEGLLSPHEFSNVDAQKLGFIYKTSVLKLSSFELLFQGESYFFPRPPIQAVATVLNTNIDFTVISVHLKAGVQSENRDRRKQAIVMLENYLRGRVDGPYDSEILVLGDFNHDLDDSDSNVVYGPVLNNPERYRLLTISVKNQGGISYLPFNRLLDHMIITTGMDDELGSELPLIPDLDKQFNSYENSVSDHLPVVLRLPVF